MRGSGEDGDGTTTTTICQSSIYLYINQYQYTYIKDDLPSSKKPNSQWVYDQNDDEEKCNKEECHVVHWAVLPMKKNRKSDMSVKNPETIDLARTIWRITIIITF